MSSRATTWDEGEKPLWVVTSWLLRPLHLGLAFPSFLYLAAMTVFLFRPPDVYSYYADRIAFGGLVFFVALRTMALREKFPFVASLSLPMIGLTALAVIRALREPFDAQIWSIIASKFIVPFTLFHLAIVVFRGAWERRHFRIFVTLALAYLVFTAIAFLLGTRSLIFPRFILDESLGFHRGPRSGPVSAGGGQRSLAQPAGNTRRGSFGQAQDCGSAALAGPTAGGTGHHDARGVDLVCRFYRHPGFPPDRTPPAPRLHRAWRLQVCSWAWRSE